MLQETIEDRERLKGRWNSSLVSQIQSSLNGGGKTLLVPDTLPFLHEVENRLDLRAISLEHQQFRGISFDDFNLEFAEFVSCTFLNCDFRNANLHHVRFVGCRFEQCDLSEVRVLRAQASDTNWLNCNLTKTNFAGSSFQSCTMQGCNLTEAIFISANDEAISFIDCNMEGVRRGKLLP